jgi:hypothetical protein
LLSLTIVAVVNIDKAGWQAFPIATKALVLLDDLTVVQGIVDEAKAIGFQPLKCLHFAGEPLKWTSTMGSFLLWNTSDKPQILKTILSCWFLLLGVHFHL